jgi:HK97 family phage prohead protease
MSKKLETKELPFELKSFNGEAGTFSGYLSVFDTEDSYGDTVIKGAFKRTLRNKKEFPLLWSHDVTMPIGGFTGKEDAKGLLIDGKLTLGVQKAQEARALMLDKVVKGLSIGYQTVKEEIDSKTSKRKLLEVNLWEGSICVFGACPGAEVAEVKSEDDLLEDEEPSIQLCEHCAKALDEEGPEESTLTLDPLEPQPISDPDNIHSLKDYAEALETLRKFNNERKANA